MKTKPDTMKTQLLICTFLLLGIVGLESLKKEQFQQLWSVISGYSLPVAPIPVKQDELRCPLEKAKESMAAANNQQKTTSITCYLFFNPGKKGFLTCESLRNNSKHNSNIL